MDDRIIGDFYSLFIFPVFSKVNTKSIVIIVRKSYQNIIVIISENNCRGKKKEILLSFDSLVDFTL